MYGAALPPIVGTHPDELVRRWIAPASSRINLSSDLSQSGPGTPTPAIPSPSGFRRKRVLTRTTSPCSDAQQVANVEGKGYSATNFVAMHI